MKTGVSWLAGSRSAATVSCASGSIAGQAQQAGQFFRMAQAGLQGHRTALRKAGQHDACGRNAARLFAGDQRFDLQLRRAQAGFILASRQIGAE